jgi:glycosyltransferase involved in cell wall biosynthesis
MPKISTTVITYNEARNIERCLKSVAPFSDEIVVVDSGSIDGTVEIAERYATRVISRDWPGYGPQKQFALENTEHEWVFSIDADEEVSPELCREIQELHFADDGYEVSRRTWYMNRWIMHGVWYPGYVLRLVRRDRAHFTDDIVHERVQVTGSVGRLRNDLHHYSYRDVAHHLDRINDLTTLAARRMYEEGRHARAHQIALLPVLAFLKAYVQKRGFLDGLPGLVVSTLHGFYVFLKYAKLLDLRLSKTPPLRSTTSVRRPAAPTSNPPSAPAARTSDPASARSLLPPALSLVIAVYERPEILATIFESLRNQTLQDFEVVLADDGSGPEIQDVVDQYQPHLKHAVQRIWHEDRGFRKTIVVNRAVPAARSDYLVFIDGDCILHHRFLERHYARRRRGQVLSGRRVMFDRTLTERLTLADVRSRRIEQVSFWWRHAGKIDRWRGFYLPALYRLRNLFRSDYQILGSNFSVHKEDFYGVNGYDERITGRGLEDNNLCARFLNSGMTICTVTQEALQYHRFHQAEAFAHSDEFIDRFLASSEQRTPYGIVKE